jgi:hypothetical protein
VIVYEIARARSTVPCALNPFSVIFGIIPHVNIAAGRCGAGTTTGQETLWS